jgi:hypothetical protein
MLPTSPVAHEPGCPRASGSRTEPSELIARQTTLKTAKAFGLPLHARSEEKNLGTVLAWAAAGFSNPLIVIGKSPPRTGSAGETLRH